MIVTNLFRAWSVDAASPEERQRLLKKSNRHPSHESPWKRIEKRQWVDGYYAEGLAILSFAWPLLIAYLTGIGMRITDVWFLGRQGPQVMAVQSLGNLYATVGGTALGLGMLTAIDTLAAQAFTAAEHPHTLGIILQRGIALVMVFSLCATALWLHAETILVQMGQDPLLARLAQTYIRDTLPVLYCSLISAAIRKFFQAIGHMKAVMWIILALVPFNLVSNYMFLEYWQLGLTGAACHIVLFYTLLLVFYVFCLWQGTDTRRYWPGWSRHATHHWGEFLRLGIPGMLSMSTEWAFEVCAIVTGVLGQTSLAAQSIVLTINTFLLMIPSALASALVVRLGHHLGANRPHHTQRCVYLATIVGIALSAMNAALLYLCRHFIAEHFTMDHDVRRAVVDLLCIASPCHFAAGISTVLSGALNACGRQSIVATLNLTSYYMIGLPFGLWLTFSYDFGLIGVWSGVTMAGSIKTLCEIYIVFRVIRWKKECKRAAKRIQDQQVRRRSFLPITQTQSL